MKNRLTLNLRQCGIQLAKPKNIYEVQRICQSFGVEAYGFFGSTNNNKFYPGITAKDIIPKEEDFVYVPFRMLTSTVVGYGSWKITDFTNKELLKNSMHLLKNKPIQLDHDYDVENFVGSIAEVEWKEEQKFGDDVIPAGIDGLFKIDAKVNPKIARGVLSDIVYSDSVTIEFDWEPSHSFEDEDEFYMKLGTMVDDKLVRRIATDIYDYHEVSLVFLGADPYAKKRKEDGSYKNPHKSKVYEGFTAAPDKEKKEYKDGSMSLVFDNRKSLLSLSASNPYKITKGTQNTNTMKNLLELILTFLAVDEATFKATLGLDKDAEITEEALKSFLSNPKSTTTEMSDDDKLRLTAFNKMVEGIDKPSITKENGLEGYSLITSAQLSQYKENTTKLGDLNKKIPGLEKTEEKYNAFVESKRKEAINLAKLELKENFTEDVENAFNSADEGQLDVLVKQYTGKVFERFVGKCKKCGESDFSLQHSYVSQGDDNSFENDEFDVDDVRRKYIKRLT